MKTTRRLYVLFLAAALATMFVVALPATGAPGTGRLLGTDANGGNLLDISTGAGTAVVIGNMGVGPAPSLATDPTTGVVYVAAGGGNPVLHTVNPANAATAPVGNTGLGFAAVGGMDFDAAGTLYAAVNIAGDGGTGSDHLATLNILTGQATIIGPFGACVGVPPIPVNGTGSCTIEGIEGIAFDGAGNLWGVHTRRGSAGAPGLYSINPGTGAAAFATAILDGGGNPPSGGLSSIQFACDGTLFGGSARGFGAADGGFLVTVNPANGLFSSVGAVSATGGSSLGGLAFDDPVCVIDIDIDIKPGSDPNSINPKSMGVVPVAILGSDTFDVTTVDVTTLAFGPAGAAPRHDLTDASVYADHLQDVNDDGFTDLVSHYRQKETGLVSGDTEACLTGEAGGIPLEGCDSVRMLGG